MAHVIVTDGDQRAALAVVRSLGRAGHFVTVLAPSSRSLAGASRHADDEHVVGHALKDPAGYARRVLELTRRAEADVLVPITEASLLAVLPNAAEFAPTHLPFPDLRAFRRASDKVWVADAARAAGIAVPAQIPVANREEANALPNVAPHAFVLKPGRSVQDSKKLSVSYVAKGTSLQDAVAALPDAAFPVLVQERIVGPGTGVFLLRWNATTRAAFAHRRIREKPPSGGVSVLRESVPLDPTLQAAAESILSRLGWRGVAMVEFKLDANSGRPYIMEINGRFWGSLQLAIDSGVDFPRLLVEAALGSAGSAPPSYRSGVRSRWLMGDIDHLLVRLRHGTTNLDLPPGAPGRLRTLANFIAAFGPSSKAEILRLSDPSPFMREVMTWIRNLKR